jgi:hypothetical protein
MYNATRPVYFVGSYSAVRKFLRHRRCRAKGQRNKLENEYYRTERSAQVRAFAIEQLRQKVNENKSGLHQTKKRKSEVSSVRVRKLPPKGKR